MRKRLTLSQKLLVAATLFGMFFGAGNLIFPVHLGQLAGSNVVPATIGFIVTAVGIPILGVAAIGMTHSDGLQALANKVAEDAIEPEKQVMFISHGDCVEDAEFLASILKEKFHVPQIHINHVGPVIGSHAGPGVLAMFYVGSKR